MVKKYPLIIMAGSDKERSDTLLDYANVDYKALIKLNGKTIIEYILDAFQNSGAISHIYIVGIPRDQLNFSANTTTENVKILEIEGENVPERLNLTIKQMMKDAKENPEIFSSGSYHGLFVTGDTPFIKPEMVKNFVEAIGEPILDLYPSIVRQEVMEVRFPKSIRTYGKLREGKFCGGDLTCFDFSMLEERLPQVRILRKNRKKFATTAFKLAPMVAVRFVLRRLSIKNLEDGTNKIFRLKSKFIEVPYAELAMDIDKPAQLDMAREEFQKLK
ncbi:MAG: NTP transferase domain-containing protein [Candidatus Kariarchaeaceae archaeon]|jgi:GTP:adenosylcobinamide-phosphate guanylyltransferase